MFETALAQGDYLFIKFPMLVGSAAASISTSMDLTVLPTISTTPQCLNGDTVSTPNSIDTRYYGLSQALPANTWYRVQVNISDPSNQSPGVQGCVWFATTSDYNTNYITYDENRCFDVISFAPIIDQTGTAFIVTGYFQYAFLNSYQTFGGTYTANFDITPSQNVSLPGALFQVTLPSGFVFTGTCSNIACSANDGSAGDYCVSTNLASLPSGTYTCTYVANVLTFAVTNAVTVATMRITIGIQNPYQYIPVASTFFATFQSAIAPIIFANSSVTSGNANGLNLVTNFTTLSLTGTVQLLWGVVPTSNFAARASGYAGCPIVLYATNTIKVYNSLQTTFTLTSAIKAMTLNSNINVEWTVMNGGLQLVDSLIYSSVFTNFPGAPTFTFTPSSSMIIFSGLSDLAATTYMIGGKFSIDVLTADSKVAAVSTTSSTPSTPNCGGVNILTGDGLMVYASVTGLAIGIKKNMEYSDQNISTTGNGDLKLYNQIFSYWSSETTQYAWGTNAVPAPIAEGTYANYFLGKGSVGATAAIWPKPVGTSGIQGFLIQLVFANSAVCNSNSTNYLGLTLGTDCSTGANPYTTQIALLLKIVFNNGVLNIPSSSYTYGAQVIGTLFPGATSGTSYLNYDSNRSTTSAIGNIIAQDTVNNFWHFSISCVGKTGGSTPDVTCFSASAFSSIQGSEAFSALAFINTAITNYPSLYPDSNVLDFIVCLKIAGYSNVVNGAPLETATTGSSQWQLVEEGCTVATASECSPTAGPGLINGYVISGMVDFNTVKTSVVNGYLGVTSTTNGFSDSTITGFIPAYLRIGFTISSPVAAGNLIGIFVGGAGIAGSTMYQGLSVYANPSINIIDTIGSVSTVGIIQGGSDYDPSTIDLWWAQNFLLVNAEVSVGTAITFNYYIPIQVSFSKIDSLNVALLGSQTNGKYTVNAVYRVFGGIISNSILLATPTFTTIGAAYYYAVAQIPDANTPYNNIMSSSGLIFTVSTLELWDSGMTNSNGATLNGCFSGSATATVVPQVNSGSGNFLLPGKSLSGFNIITDVVNPSGTDCAINTGNTGSTTPPTTNAKTSFNTWGEAFIVYVRDSKNIFSSGTLTWGYANSNTNKCFPQTIGYYDGTQNRNIFTIFCTTDAFANSAFGTGSKTISFSAFAVPFYWGSNYKLISMINYAWSSYKGVWASFNGDPTNTTGTSTAWTYLSGCTASDSLSLAQNSYDVPIVITLTSTNGVTFNLAVKDYLNLALTSTQNSTFYTDCIHSSFNCSALPSTTTTFTLSNILGNPPSPLSISDSTITINGWIDTGSIGSACTYSVAISYNGNSNTIEQCSSSSTGGIKVSGAALVNVVSMDSWTFMSNEGARGVFSFAFSYPRLIRIGYDFELNVGPLAGPNQNSVNYRCLILQNKVVSNLWLSITGISAGYVSTVTSKSYLSTGGNFTYKCIGGNSPDGSVDFTNLATGTLERKPGGTAITTLPAANQYTVPTPSLPPEASSSSASISKFFNTRGFDSDYSISFTPVANNISTTGLILVEFSESISPKYNKYGLPECYVNGFLAYCEFSDERRILVWPTVDLLTTSFDDYTVTIAGVTQPNGFAPGDLDSNMQIYFALCPTSDCYAEVTESAYLSETWDAASTSTSIASIFIHYFAYSMSKFRATTTFTFILNIPATSFTADGSILWIQFPGSLASPLFYNSTPVFSFVRVFDLTNTNLVQNYSLLSARRYAVAMAADDFNTIAINYTLTISGIPTPDTPSPQGVIREDFRIWTSNDNVSVQASTASGNRNLTNYISWNEGSMASSKILYWYDSSYNVIQGTTYEGTTYAWVSTGVFNAQIYLSAGLAAFSSTFNYSIIGGSAYNFNLLPTNPSYPFIAMSGSKTSSFYIGAFAGNNEGLYYLQWADTDTSGYSSIPILNIMAVQTMYTPNLIANSFNVPYGGGISDPIVIDFSSCIPVEDVTVIATIVIGFDSTDSWGITLNGQQSQSLSLNFSSMTASYQMSFFAFSNIGSSGTNNESVAIISFSMAGTDGAYYNSPDNVTINLVKGSTIIPNPMTPTLSNSNLGLGCDSQGSNLFALATYSNAAQYNGSYIEAQSYTQKISLTSLDPNDPNYTLFGYVYGLLPSTYSYINLSGFLKAGGNLTVYSYCLSTSMTLSTTSTKLNWIQPDNGGTTLMLEAFFSAPLTSDQKVSVACALVNMLELSVNVVETDEGTFCNNYSSRLLQNSTNSTYSTTINSTTNSTTTTNTSNSSSTVSYSAYFYILKNYLASSDNTSAEVLTQISNSSFLPYLVAQLSNVSLPTLTSNTFYSVVLSLSSTVPIINLTSIAIDIQSINATFNLTNINGMIYAGIEAIVVNGTATPNASSLIQGLDGLQINLASTGFVVASAGAPVTINFTNLALNTTYYIYYVANNMDISINDLFSPVGVANATTLIVEPGSSASFGSIMKSSLMVMIIIILSIFVLVD